MISPSRTQLGYSYDPVADRWLLASRPEDSLLAPQNTHASARRFLAPDGATWWVHIMRPGGERDIARWGSPQVVVLRFRSGTVSRYLRPIPDDWRECDDLTLWGYCEEAAR